VASRFRVYSSAHIFSGRSITYLISHITGHTGSFECVAPLTGKSLALIYQTEHLERPLWNTLKFRTTNFQLMKGFPGLHPFREGFTRFLLGGRPGNC
jgi:hypothetical protein